MKQNKHFLTVIAAILSVFIFLAIRINTHKEANT